MKCWMRLFGECDGGDAALFLDYRMLEWFSGSRCGVSLDREADRERIERLGLVGRVHDLQNTLRRQCLLVSSLPNPLSNLLTQAIVLLGQLGLIRYDWAYKGVGCHAFRRGFRHELVKVDLISAVGHHPALHEAALSAELPLQMSRCAVFT